MDGWLLVGNQSILSHFSFVHAVNVVGAPPPSGPLSSLPSRFVYFNPIVVVDGLSFINIPSKSTTHRVMKPEAISPIFRKRKKVNGEKYNGSSFVPCPLKCGKHVPFYKINDHLDLCSNNESKGKEIKKRSLRDSLVEVDDNGDSKCLDGPVKASREGDKSTRKRDWVRFRGSN